MKLHEKMVKKILEMNSEYTLFDDVFLPMFIGSNKEMQAILDGYIVFNPAMKGSSLEELLSRIPEEYIGKGEVEAVKNGGYANLAELMGKKISMYPLVYENERFLRLDRKFRRVGSMAVVIIYPDEFLQRFQHAVGVCFANQYYGAFGSAQYRGVSTNPFDFCLFHSNKEESWKKELILAIRMNPNLRVTDTNFKSMTEEIPLNLGDLSDVAVMCSVGDLVKGNFPKECLNTDYLKYLDSFKVPKKEIKQWVFNVAANVMSITPTREWMEKLEEIFPRNKWKAVSQVERLFADGDGMPRLAFFANAGQDRVFIHINKVELHFYDYGGERRVLVDRLIHFIEKECQTRFCHMMLETHADLGVVTDKRILSQSSYREERTCQKGELYEFQFLEADYKLVPSIMGRELARKDWHYGVRLSTPDNEHTMWYDADSVLDFFDDAVESNIKRIRYLMKGDAHGRYRKI